MILVSETDERAQQDYEEHLRYMLRTLMHIPAKYAEAPGYRTARSVAESLVSQFALHGKSRYSTKTDFDWKQIVEAGNVIAGSPATVRDRLREMIKSLRVGNITAHLNIGSMPHHLAVKKY